MKCVSKAVKSFYVVLVHGSMIGQIFMAACVM